MKIDRKFIERIATYLLGVAIGLLLLGFIQIQRSQGRQQRQQQQQAPQWPDDAASAPATGPQR